MSCQGGVALAVRAQCCRRCGRLLLAGCVVWAKVGRLSWCGGGGFAYFATLYVLGFRPAAFNRNEADRRWFPSRGP